MRFADLADGGCRLAPLLALRLTGSTVLVAIGQGGLVTGAALAHELGVAVTPVVTTRTEAGVSIELTRDVTGRDVVVVDDGVETGTAARAAGVALRAAGAASVVLAVPVCPREAEASLRPPYDEVVAVLRPLVRRSLHWHYESFA